MQKEWSQFKSKYENVFTASPDNSWDLTVNFQDSKNRILMFNRTGNTGSQEFGFVGVGGFRCVCTKRDPVLHYSCLDIVRASPSSSNSMCHCHAVGGTSLKIHRCFCTPSTPPKSFNKSCAIGTLQVKFLDQTVVRKLVPGWDKTSMGDVKLSELKGYFSTHHVTTKYGLNQKDPFTTCRMTR